MGQAKQKSAQLAQWKGSLSADERVIFSVSESAYANIVRALGATGICYRISLFLSAYLLNEHGIQVEPVVGFVCDGESELMASHAWIECNGRKTDLGLTLTENPDAQPPGALIILDREFGHGRAKYTYHRERSPAANRIIEEFMRDPAYSLIVRHKEAEHEKMTAIAKSPRLIREYLDAAPDGLDYQKLALRIGKRAS